MAMKFFLCLIIFLMGFNNASHAISEDKDESCKKHPKHSLYFPPADVVDTFLKSIPDDKKHDYDLVPAFEYLYVTWKRGPVEQRNLLPTGRNNSISPQFQKICIFSDPLQIQCWYEQCVGKQKHWFYIMPAGQIDIIREEKKGRAEYFFSTQTKDPTTFLVPLDAPNSRKIQY